MTNTPAQLPAGSEHEIASEDDANKSANRTRFVMWPLVGIVGTFSFMFVLDQYTSYVWERGFRQGENATICDIGTRIKAMNASDGESSTETGRVAMSVEKACGAARQAMSISPFSDSLSADKHASRDIRGASEARPDEVSDDEPFVSSEDALKVDTHTT